MTIRGRLVLGLCAIAAVLLVPFVLALQALDSMHLRTQRLQEQEWTGSLLAGRIRQAVEEMRNYELYLTIGDDPSYADSMRVAYEKLRVTKDSLTLRAPGITDGIDSTVRRLGDYIAERERTATPRSVLAADQADTLFNRFIRPAINSIHGALPAIENALDARTGQYFVEVAAASRSAINAGLIGLTLATLLAAVIAVWLTRSISEPVQDLQRAMGRVSDGDFTYKLRTEQSAPAEFTTLARSYRSMTRQLVELDKLKAEFVSVASHELKTPINVIVGYLQLLDEGVYGELNDKQREICRLLDAQSQSLARLVHQLLDVSRFEAGGGRLEVRPFNLNRFLSDLHGAFEVLAMQRKVSFRLERGADLPDEVHWDEDRMSEVVGNLLSNAFKFTPPGGTVELRVYNVDDSIRVSIADTGAGIPPEHLPHIFGKFFQADNQASSTRRGSAGLGLAIAKAIVDAHEGDIRVDSIIGSGTTFTITLPRRAVGGKEVFNRRLTPLTGEEAHV